MLISYNSERSHLFTLNIDKLMTIYLFWTTIRAVSVRLDKSFLDILILLNIMHLVNNRTINIPNIINLFNLPFRNIRLYLQLIFSYNDNILINFRLGRVGGTGKYVHCRASLIDYARFQWTNVIIR